MMRVYLDNAASTPLDHEVFEAMRPYFLEHSGNPSSIHHHGRNLKSAIEISRKKVADLMDAAPSEIFFTSGGTEADNLAIIGWNKCHSGEKHIITSPLEHHAVLHTVEDLKHRGEAEVHYVKVDDCGRLDYEHLEEMPDAHKNSSVLVSLMHANNEIGNVYDIERIGELCKRYNAAFHSDTVQTVGHLPISVRASGVTFIAASAHKFHGPKGIGFIYINGNKKIPPLIFGGGQERNMRGGTENVAYIVGLAKALELSLNNTDAHRGRLRRMKNYFKTNLEENIPGIEFNGDITGENLDTVLNVRFPNGTSDEVLLMNLDIAGVSASGGSACSSGSDKGSHVLRAIGMPQNKIQCSVRFSFGRQNTMEELDFALGKIKEFFPITTTH